MAIKNSKEKEEGKTMKIDRRIKFGAPLAVAAGILSFEAVAWACTPPNGNTRVLNPACPAVSCSLKKGDTLVADAQFMYYPPSTSNDWVLYIDTGWAWCMSPGYRVDPNTYHQAAPDTSRVPTVGTASGAANVNVGTYDVCFNNGGGGGESTTPVSITFTRR